MRYLFLGFLLGCSARADACTPPFPFEWHLNLTGVVEDGKPVADLSPWHHWSVRANSSDSHWTLSGNNEVDCVPLKSSRDADVTFCVGLTVREVYRAK